MNIIKVGANYRTPDGHELIDIPPSAENASIGWSYQNGALIDPQSTKTAAEAREERKAEVSALRDSKYLEGYDYTINGNTYNFQCDQEAQKDMTAIMVQFVLQATNPHGGSWRATDNTAVSMTDAEVQAFIQATFLYVKNIKQAAWDHKEALDALNAKQDILDYNIETLWP